MEIWGKMQDTPKDAQKQIAAGRLKGFTDINPMFRFKRLTETFGPCGVGWNYTIDRLWMENFGDEVKAFVQVSILYKQDDKWMGPVPGIGGSSFVSKERGGAYVNDECYKMALSDAIGTACKALGMSADIYYSKDRTKYSGEDEPGKTDPQPNQPQYVPPKCEECGKEIRDVPFKSGKIKKAIDIIAYTKQHCGKQMCYYCWKKFNADKDSECQNAD